MSRIFFRNEVNCLFFDDWGYFRNKYAIAATAPSNKTVFKNVLTFEAVDLGGLPIIFPVVPLI